MRITKVILFFLCTVFPLIGVPKESLSTKDIFVGDTFDYMIEFKDILPSSITFPSGDFYPEGEDLPIFKVIEVKKSEFALTLKIRFYTSGEFILPIEWEENSSIASSQLKIKIQSRLSGSETDIDENDPPIIFDGPYLHRLFIAIALFLVLVYLLYAMFVFWKKQSKIVNADWEKIPELENRTKKLMLIEDFLKNDSVLYKDFCYMFTSYCKEEYSYRFKTNLLHLTDSGFLAYLYDHSELEESILREIRIIFRSVKYSDFTKLLPKEEAISLWLDWKSKLKL